MSTPLLNRRRLMMQIAGGGGIEYLEYVELVRHTESLHVQFARSITNFELRFNMDTDDTQAQLSSLFVNDGQDHTRVVAGTTYTTIGFLLLNAVNQLRELVLANDSAPKNQYEFVRNLYWLRKGDNQWMYWKNNAVETYRSDMSYNTNQNYYGTTQSGFAINEFWIYWASTLGRIRRVEVYDGSTLVETFLPARVNGSDGLYSDIQRVFYPLYG